LAGYVFYFIQSMRSLHSIEDWQLLATVLAKDIQAGHEKTYASPRCLNIGFHACWWHVCTGIRMHVYTYASEFVGASVQALRNTRLQNMRSSCCFCPREGLHAASPCDAPCHLHACCPAASGPGTPFVAFFLRL